MGVFRPLGLQIASRLGKATYHIVIPCICWKIVLKPVACHNPTALRVPFLQPKPASRYYCRA